MVALLTLDVRSKETDVLARALEDAFREPTTPRGALGAEGLALLVRRCLAFPDDMRDEWRAVKSAAEAGEPLDYDALGKDLRGLFERRADMIARVAALARSATTETGRATEGAELLEEAAEELERIRASVFAHWPWSNRPGPPVDREILRRSREARARGEGGGEDVRSILDRLENGGPLLKE